MVDLSRYIEKLSRNVNDDCAWGDLFAAISATPDPAAILALLTSRHQARHDAAQFAFSEIIDLVLSGNTAALEKLYDAAGQDSAFRGLFAFGRALIAVADFDLHTAVPLMREAAFLTAHCCEQVFAHEQEFRKIGLGKILQQACLLEDSDYAPAPPPAGGVALPDMAPDAPLFFACCCDTYFTAYAERFVRQLSSLCPESWYLIHVMNPSPEGNSLRERLRREFPRGGFSTETCREDGAFYASRRFMLCPAILQRYSCDVIVMDIDSFLHPTFPTLLEKSRGAAIAYIANGTELLPSFLISAAYLYLPKNSPIAHSFTSKAAAYLARKLTEPMVPWTVDQAALYWALCQLGPDRRETMNLTAKIPHAISYIVDEAGHIVDHTTRMSRRQGRDLRYLQFDENRRPVFRQN